MAFQGPVLALGLDAVEGPLVEDLIDQGRLPTLRALREGGTVAEVRARPEGFLSMVWPTLFAGQTLGTHGCYFNKLWSPTEQCLRYLDPSWLPITPFWDDLDPRFRVALLDIPFSTLPSSGFSGCFLNGWQAHDDFGKLSVPSGLHRDLRRRLGRPAMGPELFGPQNTRTLERQQREGMESLRQFSLVVKDILAGDRWDLVMAVFGGVHRATHYLWSLDEADLTDASPGALRRLGAAREELYEEADRAIGAVLELAPRGSRVIVFALHGMGRNRGWAERFPEIVAHVHARGSGPSPRQGRIYRLKKGLPWPWLRQITMRLPTSVNQALVPIWSRGMLDWRSTRFFALPLDLHGYLRVNLLGREAQGIVEPGPEFDELLEELSEDFLSLRDLRNDEPIVAGVDRVDDLVGREAPRRDLLPDLIVRWADSCSHGSPGVRSRYGEVTWNASDPLPSGRSGNHTPLGWLIASGPGISRGRVAEPVDSVNIAPTLLDWMGAPIPARLEGSPLSSLQEGPVPDGTGSPSSSRTLS